MLSILSNTKNVTLNFRTLTILTVILASFMKSASAFSIIKKAMTPAKPLCEPREPCRVGFVGLEFCSCPENRQCPSTPDVTLNYERIDYHFCQPTTVQTCREGEVAWIRRGLRQTIFCTCPAPLKLVSEIWDMKTDTTEYKCIQQRPCRTPDDACMVRNRVQTADRMVSLLKGLCQCPNGQQCLETSQVINGTSIDLEQDIFKCGTQIDDRNAEMWDEEGYDENVK